MLQPKRSKFRKQFRGKNRGVASRGNEVEFGTFGLQAVTRGQYTARQIEATRKVIAQATKRVGQMWIRVFPDIPITKKAVGVKMGSGKGDIHEYIAKVLPGKVLFEIDGVTEEVAREAFRRAGHKIPMKTRVIARVGPAPVRVYKPKPVAEDEVVATPAAPEEVAPTAEAQE